MNNITREDLERVFKKLQEKSDCKKKVLCIAGIIAAVAAVAAVAVFLYKKLSPDLDDFEDDLDDDDFFEDFDEDPDEDADKEEDIFVDEDAEGEK